ncbi:MAG: DEAD/DEAH box helicase, partial [Dehalococcoidia bacterium]|nr:DEAD/DEAH box helicase [Dehalococcoidia bacterium]
MVQMAVVLSDKVALLRKILEVEHKNGYSDQAVIGGLDVFLRRWAGSLREGIKDQAHLRRFNELGVATPGYASLSREQRRDWVGGMHEWLDGAGGSSGKDVTVSAPVRRAVAPKSKPQVADTAPGLDSSIINVSGISGASVARFSRLGVKTIRDLLYFFPRRHLDYSQRKTIAELAPGVEQTVVATVWEARKVRLGKGWGAEATVGDETGNMRAVWFNQPYLAMRMPVNGHVIFSGRVDLYKGGKVFQSPEWELMEGGDLVHTGRLVPVYPLTQGLWSRPVRKLVKEVVDRWVVRVRDFLPEETRKRCNLLALPQAISQAHYPDSQERKDEARQRLAFDELLLLQLGVVARKREWQSIAGLAFQVECPEVGRFLSCLPFELTSAQRRAWQEIIGDLGKSSPMSRLLEGDVGSGKTVVATAGLLLAVANGCQAALMAPTEILAEQHFATLCRLMSGCGTASGDGQCLRTFTGVLARPLTMGLLTGSMGQKEKGEVQRAIAAGEVDIVLGTHALIQKGVVFKKLGLVVVDEQHRFGVEQRSALRQKGFNPHMLVMT